MAYADPEAVKAAEEKIIRAGRKRGNLPEGLCSLCDDLTYSPSHFGSSFCRSRGLGAQGGTRAHCTCDSCF